MKNSIHRIAGLALALGVAGLTTTFAQDQSSDGTDSSSNDSTPSKHFHHHGGPGSALTPDEQAQLKKDYEAALADNDDLKTESDNLKQQEQALRQQAEALHKKIHAAMVAEDPSVAPILAKLEADHKDGGDWHHHGDKSTDSDSSSTTSDSGDGSQ